tara:strand:+ start:743 stop:967 length:225 start_codon:yes stop_codon:yes gene_type:complete
VVEGAEDLRSECHGTMPREDGLCALCYEEVTYIPWWLYEMNKTDPIYSNAPSQKDIGKWIRKVCNLDSIENNNE